LAAQRIGLAVTFFPGSGGMSRYQSIMTRAFAAAGNQGHELVLLDLGSVDVTLDRVENLPVLHYAHTYPNTRLRGFARRFVETFKRGRRQPALLRPLFTEPRVTSIDAPASDPQYNRWLADNGIGYVVYLQGAAWETVLSEVPYAVFIPDLQHVLQPEFPEVSWLGQWVEREYVYRKAICRADLLLVDSETGCDDIVRAYGVYRPEEELRERSVVLPYVADPQFTEGPAMSLADLRCELGVPDRYFFYPAQYWPHKAHLCILRALEIARLQHEVELKIVFTGAADDFIRQYWYRELRRISNFLRLDHQVTWLPYVSDEQIKALYANAVGLVMPTHFGPTNIPIVEAWSLNCPVIYSDIPGCREQAGDAALLVDPRSPVALANAMLQVWQDKEVGQILRKKGKDRLQLYSWQRLTEAAGRALKRIEQRLPAKG
jgi:glycosyltransferase involved in cell wall biosynthesis